VVHIFPCLSDVEVLTMEVVGEFIGLPQDKQIWEYFKRHFQEWFPNLKSRTSYVKQCSGLLSIKTLLLADVFKMSYYWFYSTTSLDHSFII
jgi:hypothetical protein